METQFAPAERSSHSEVLKDNHKMNITNLIVAVTETTNTNFLILNLDRQIVFANTQLMKLIDLDINNILGKRPGEIFNCINSGKMEGGCGTHEFCRQCGAVKAILSAIDGKASENECRLLAHNGEGLTAFDLKVKAQPFDLDSKRYILFSVLDISDTKRREVLERTFFHDILNTAFGVHGASWLLKNKLEKAHSEHYDTVQMLYRSVNKLVDEIKSQRQLLSAENGSLETDLKDISISDTIVTSIDIVRMIKEFKDREIIFSLFDDIIVNTDETLLVRVLVNMIKNAVEASDTNDLIKIDVIISEQDLGISINNPSYMSKEIQAQIFQRSFSTKGANRGIGTYSIKLLGEKYLKGKVWFESTKDNGTTFYLQIPK